MKRGDVFCFAECRFGQEKRKMIAQTSQTACRATLSLRRIFLLAVVGLLEVALPVCTFAESTRLSKADASFWGETAADYAGQSVACAGDVNGDGYDDILVGAYGNDLGSRMSGQTYLIFGKDVDWAMDVDLSESDASFIGEDRDDNSGRSVACAGDVNGDGFDDILIGAYQNYEGGEWAGQTYLIFGKDSGWVMGMDLSTADASFVGEDVWDYSGWSVASAGDVNGDSYDDILIGAYWNHENQKWEAGQTYLIFGKISGWSMDTELSAVDASFLGEYNYDHCGWSVASAGDVNNDGYDDILIGARDNDDGGGNAGKTYLIFGKAYGWTMDTDLADADVSFIGQVLENSGCSVASAGDVNGDGYDDILIGARHNSEGGSNAGKSYLFFGRPDFAWPSSVYLTEADASFIGEEVDDKSGLSVACAGDVNRDGYDDIIIGAPYNDASGDGAGKTYLILGKETGDWSKDTDLADADVFLLGEGVGDNSGFSVACAGDVNGDGYGDFLIGAPNNNDGGSKAGQAYLIISYYAQYVSDLDGNGVVNLADFSVLAEYWLEPGCDLVNDWCDGVNIDRINSVDLDDLFIMASNWLARLVAHWKLDEVVSVIASDSAESHDGVLNGGAIWRPYEGRIGGALEFDGGDDYVEITGYKGVAGSYTRTVTAWIKTDAGGTFVFWGDTVGNGRAWFNQVVNGVVTVSVWGSQITGTTIINDYQWHHVAIVLPDVKDVDVQDILLYVDGNPETTNNGGSQLIDTATTVDVILGGDHIGGVYTASFCGLLDDVRIYSYALSEADIQVLANPGD
jgi:hypothetical protein